MARLTPTNYDSQYKNAEYRNNYHRAALTSQHKSEAAGDGDGDGDGDGLDN